MNAIELFREASKQHIFKNLSFKKAWAVWLPQIKNILGKNYNADDLIKLGNHLRDIFLSTSDESRDQRQISVGGNSWESLICWYLNLCMIGSKSVVIKPLKKFTPNAIKEAMSVNYGNYSSNSESDLIAITFPSFLSIDDKSKIFKKIFTECEQKISELEVVTIQCKTNWNDNAQIPMLWDMIYKSTEFKDINLSIGKNSRHISHFKSFKYSFVTVPTQKDLSKFKSSSTSVNRVRNLSGLNYWGADTKDGVAKNINNMFTDLFLSGSVSGNVRDDLNKSIKDGLTEEYFS